MKKIALIAYDGELTCFAHVMLYALDFASKGYEVKVVIEGAATRLIAELIRPEAPFSNLFREMVDRGLPIDGEMKGHPSLERFVNEGYEIITF